MVTFSILLEPSVEFRPCISFAASAFDLERTAPLLAHIGFVELLSYWKAACPRRIILEQHSLSEQQRLWWRDLFLHGLGEFYFRNGIDPSDPALFEIEPQGPLPLSGGWIEPDPPPGPSELILAAGGKDSSLSLELLKKLAPQVRREAMILGPSRSAVASVSLAQYPAPFLISRSIDKNLLALNAQGYLNGHTPFSAYLAFLALLVAELRGHSAVIVSNERSASEANTLFHELPINHQYSKTLRFERLFRQYTAREFPGCASYYSLIRPLYDLQVSRLFAHFAPHHLTSFRSCNVGQRQDRWCGECPKCAFVYLTLAPFLSQEKQLQIFGTDLFQSPHIISAIEELTGLRDHKPFECVGTISESRDALSLLLARYRREGRSTPPALSAIASALADKNLLPDEPSATATLHAWSHEHELPSPYADTLHALVEEGI